MVPLMGLPEGKILAVSQNRQNTIKNHEITYFSPTVRLIFIASIDLIAYICIMIINFFRITRQLYVSPYNTIDSYLIRL